ncbi:iron-sulfur cluster assembly scaffold protein [Erythrobacter dokdonensis]|uniref:Iron-sulfur cluster biosynthesis protein, NifU-like protein n=1 Tax=Erythrobacter dokdonensis DSW-74 TaxID=1300349 RepID=A0A1A7BJ69_9SPHN|nr:iron-sulfur cluster assembly scaffold protein [Erythrobacter dokdonensis]OBV12603.1 Iron-sulfur cluster biosynthesis protein, NifU-like protein [Erythrobacter dokdonensis DSW-74]
MAAATRPTLYSPDILALATTLAAYPLDDNLPLRAEARSRTCGSAITIGVALGAQGTIERIGMQLSACAIGQASAGLLAREAAGAASGDITLTMNGIVRWLTGAGPLPEWPGLDLLAPAREHPARHGALLLPWTAACKALSSSATAG